MPNWVGATAKQIARGVRRGDTSATQVVADHLEHIAAREPLFGAFRIVRGGEAATEAEKVDEQHDLTRLPLAGVPVAVKENTAIAGLPTWHGSAAARGPIEEEDHEVVRRLRGAGAIVVATSRMPELGVFALTDDSDGPTRNPWDLTRTPGGSSGGAAAAVAAGLVPMAHGNDGFGSLRIPAACCGLVALKPGRGVVPPPAGATAFFGMGEHGVLTTTVADAAIGFSVLAGRDSAKLVEPSGLRIAISTRSPVPGVRADAPNRDAVAVASRLLVAAGHTAVACDPAYPASIGTRGFATWLADATQKADEAGLPLSALQRRNRTHARLGKIAMRRGYVREDDREGFRRRSIAFFADNGFDVLVTPALAATPPAAEGWVERSWSANALACMRFAPFAAPWNLAALPALVVPVGVRPDGLPLAVQLVGPPGSETTLLAVAGQFEMAAPWQRHAPSVFPAVR
ncbi:amidase [Catenuloplanes atrovinosus]|uniref:Amidase n=1 Tax=Catenuloplanes atrovinosus TaxID=137266 RepID=A0AAE3YVH3_9ACTN|nr:amidase [Catenuloplanes atrovinosus]